jgi:exodeoxyribonuclease-3
VFRIATWNVNSLRVRLPQVLQWLEAEQPDVLALQETKLSNDEFPLDAFSPYGYHAVCSGQKTYNGVALISRTPPRDPVTGFPGSDDPQRRILHAAVNGVDVLNLYVPNGARVGSDKFEYKLEWLGRLRAFVAGLLEDGRPLVVVGDFNIAPAEIDVYDPARWEGKVLFSEPERAEFRKLLDLGLVDCFRLLNSEPGQYTWWDYRAGAYRRNMGLRIDHILASTALAARCRACRIYRDVRKAERPSDHVPVLAGFDIDPKAPPGRTP